MKKCGPPPDLPDNTESQNNIHQTEVMAAMWALHVFILSSICHVFEQHRVMVREGERSGRIGNVGCVGFI